MWRFDCHCSVQSHDAISIKQMLPDGKDEDDEIS
jgi:hypothetical protein